MAHFIYSAFCNESGESTIGGQIAAVKNIIDKKLFGKVVSARAFVHWSRGEDYYSDDWHGTVAKEGGGRISGNL